MHCDIVMVTWNQVSMTRAALESLRRCTGYPYRLILIDNSDDPDARRQYSEIASSQEFGETLFIQNEANIGWLRATNLGLGHVTGEFVCLLNNDVICGPDWLKRCVDLMERYPDIALVNPKGNERSENARVRNVAAYAEELGRRNDGLYTELDHCAGFCMVIRKSVLDQIGHLDEVFDGGYYEDDDLSRRAQARGFRCAQCDDAFVLHLGSQSFRKVPEERRRLVERNRRICQERWGVIPRILLLAQSPGIDREAMLALVRTTRVYLIASRNLPDDVLSIRHQHLSVLRRPLLWAPLHFLALALYLSAKRRIDSARICFTNSLR